MLRALGSRKADRQAKLWCCDGWSTPGSSLKVPIQLKLPPNKPDDFDVLDSSPSAHNDSQQEATSFDQDME